MDCICPQGLPPVISVLLHSNRARNPVFGLSFRKPMVHVLCNQGSVFSELLLDPRSKRGSSRHLLLFHNPRPYSILLRALHTSEPRNDLSNGQDIHKSHAPGFLPATQDVDIHTLGRALEGSGSNFLPLCHTGLPSG